jgi:NAD-dependent SIR2 family protein deacetylase
MTAQAALVQPVEHTEAVRRIAGLLTGRSWTVLSGAGASTDSGIPDYRGPTSIRATPMLYGEFVGSHEAQQRYWARSFLGWRRIGQARPNEGHRALVALEQHGLQGVVTQNVDGLHAAAGRIGSVCSIRDWVGRSNRGMQSCGPTVTPSCATGATSSWRGV